MIATITRGSQTLAAEHDGEGPAVVGLHGLTATRRYVLMGSRLLERSGRRVVLYDARGHGSSSPARDGDYAYGAQAGDLEAVIDALGIERALLVGASMGAHTAIAFALEHPERVAALAIVTPAHDPERFPSELERWDALARGLREEGVEGFIAAYQLERVPPSWRETVERYPGTSGSTHGERNDTAPAAIAANTPTPVAEEAATALEV